MSRFIVLFPRFIAYFVQRDIMVDVTAFMSQRETFRLNTIFAEITRLQSEYPIYPSSLVEYEPTIAWITRHR